MGALRLVSVWTSGLAAGCLLAVLVALVPTLAALPASSALTGVPLTSWGAGRMTLLGDAAHPMTTVLGQGACMALEDGVVLAEALVEHGAPDGLRAYEERRLARTTAMMAVSARLNSSASRESAFRGWLRNTAIRFAFKRGIGDRYEALMRAPF